MIRDIVWWWEQLNGPQVTGIMRPIFIHLQEQLDEILEYLDKMSIETANNEHLTLIGKLMGVPRTYIQEYTINNLFYTYELETEVSYGFSLMESESRDPNQKDVGKLDPHTGLPYTEDDIGVGGKFTEFLEGQTGRIYQVPDNYYRAILQGVVASGARIGSLACMDYIIASLYRLEKGSDVEITTDVYNFEWWNGALGETNKAPGDITIDLGNVGTWGLPTLILAVIQSFCEGVFAPEPYWWAELDLSR